MLMKDISLSEGISLALRQIRKSPAVHDLRLARSSGVQEAANQINPAQGEPILPDALAYLEQVKDQFVDQPSVYNLFLDIMGDFKSQA